MGKKNEPWSLTRAVYRLSLAMGTIAFFWMLLSAGFVTINMNTFKFVPAALFFILSFGLSAVTVPSPSIGPATGIFLILAGTHILLTIFPSILGHNGYDEVFLIGVNIICFAVCLYLVFMPNPVSCVRRILTGMTAVLGIVSVIGILEYFGLALLSLNGHTYTIAVFFNNPNIYSGVLLVLLPAAYINSMIEKKGNRRVLWITASILGFLNLLMAQSRAAMIGHGICLIILILFLPAIFDLSRKKKILIRFLLVSGFITALALFMISNTQFRDKIIRTFTTENSRLPAWGIALDIWTRDTGTILFGNGVGSFHPLFYSFKPPGYRLGPHMNWWDAAHNEYLDLLCDGGIFSLGAFLALLWFSGRAAFRAIRRESTPRRIRLLMLFPFSAIASLLADGFFSTNLRTNYILVLFYLTLACVPALADASSQTHPRGPAPAGRGTRFLLVAVFCLLIAFCPSFIQRFSSEHMMLKAHLTENPVRKEQLLKRGAETDPRNIAPLSALIRFYLETGQFNRFQAESEAVEALIPNYADIGYLNALSALRQGAPEQSAALLEEYLETNRGDTRAEHTLLYVYAATGAYVKAVQQWDRINAQLHLKADSAGYQITVGSGTGIRRTGDTVIIGRNEAEKILSAAAGSTVVSPEVFQFRLEYLSGDILRQLGDTCGAALYMNRAVRAAQPEIMTDTDRQLHKDAALFLAGYYAERLKKADSRQEEITNLEGLLGLGYDEDLVRRLVRLYRGQGSFKRAALLLKRE